MGAKKNTENKRVPKSMGYEGAIRKEDLPKKSEKRAKKLPRPLIKGKDALPPKKARNPTGEETGKKEPKKEDTSRKNHITDRSPKLKK